ncbi:MAG: MBL fold metallo-hydrolase [Solobacterium sp.]|nr:MBL fold metallo-hydrolase [Solobacterium sp.]
MGISKPLVFEIAENTYAINEFGMVTCYMLVGKQRGLLIDCGTGMYNIREIADELCDKPYDVVITHADFDHYCSMDMWDKVWLHPLDLHMMEPAYQKRAYEMFLDYPQMMVKPGTFAAYDVTPAQMRYPQKTPEFLPLQDGQIFDLGGRYAEVIHTPGHSQGEVVVIDPSVRILFSGDACNTNLILVRELVGNGRGVSVNTALRGLLKIKAREKDFDRNFNGHIGYGGSTVHRCVPKEVLDEAIELLTGVVQGKAVPEMFPVFDGIYGEWPTVSKGYTRISYDPSRIIDDGEIPAV